MFISSPVVLCDGDVSSDWPSTDSWSCVPWNFFDRRFFLLVLSTVISLLNIYLFLLVKLPLSELGSSSSVDHLIVRINFFDTGVELECVLACQILVNSMNSIIVWNN